MADGDSSATFEYPTIQPFQFDAGGDGEVNRSVNLFRGDVNLSVSLVSLSGRNGLDVAVTAMYQSNVQGIVNTSNRDAPVGVLGLGWHLPIEMIVAESPGTATRDGNRYFLVRDEDWNSLNRSSARWRRGFLPASLAATLDAGHVTDELRTAFGAATLPLARGAKVTVVTHGASWSVSDAVNEVVYAVEAAGQQLAVYDGGLAYELTSYQPWRIRYYPDFERWEITREDGITTVYGGGLATNTDGSKASLGTSVQWGVRWGNWVGPSTVTHDPSNPSARAQQQYPLAWNRSKSYDPWGGEVLFEYTAVEQPVGSGGLPYTKASYVSQVVDEFGRTIAFAYDNKTFDTAPSGPKEYQDPYKPVPNDDPDAYQSRYETKYLKRIDVSAATDEPLYSLVFDSSPVTYATLPSTVPPEVIGETFKRTLHSIQKVMPSGQAAPPIRFTYYQASDLNAGALDTVTHAKGSTATFTYQQKQLPTCARSFVVDNPLGAPGTPRVWFGGDYAVVTRYDGQGRLSIGAYTWLGRWQTWEPPDPVVNDYVDPDQFHALIEEDFFVLYYATANGQNFRFWAFHRDANLLGSWLPAPGNPITLQTTRVQAASGDRFFAIADRDAGELHRYRWDAPGGTWAADTIATSDLCASGDASQSTLFVTGDANCLLTFCYDDVGAPGSKASVLTLWYLDQLGTWNQGDRMTVADLTISGDPIEDHLTWSPTPSYVAATYATNDFGSILEYAIRIWAWGADGSSAYKFVPASTFAYSVNKSQPSNEITIPYVAEAVSAGLIASGPHLLRFNGVEWLENDNLRISMPVVDKTAFEFAYGPDVAIKTENADNQILASAQAFDPDSDSAAWTSAAAVIYSGAPTLPRETHYFPTAAADLLTWDTNVYGRGTSTDWVAPLQNPLAPPLPTSVNTTTIINQGPEFVAYLVQSSSKPPVAQGTEVVVLENGQILTTETIAENFFAVSQGTGGKTQAAVDGVAPAGPSSLLTFLPLDARFDNASQLTLHRFVRSSIQEPLTDYPVAAVEIFDGYQTLATAYDFDETTALIDPGGAVAKYFMSTVYPGTANPSTAASGHTEYRFVNGLPPDQGESPYPSVVDGSPLKTIAYDAGGTVVLETDLKWQAFTTVEDLDDGSTRSLYGAFARIQEMTTTKDGVRRPVTFAYDRATGMPLGNATVVYNADGAAETNTTAMIYGFRAYDRLGCLNILSPTVQSTEAAHVGAGTSAIKSAAVTTWAAFARAPLDGQELSCFGGHKTYRWLGGAGSSAFDFAAWSDGEPGADWLKTSEVAVRTPHGLVQERTDPAGLVRSTRFDVEERLPVASFTSASLSAQEAYYYGFEDYENAGDWPLDHSATPIVSGASHTGSRSLQIPAGVSAAALELTPAGACESFLVSCWSSTPAGYDPAHPAGLRVQLSRAGALVGSPIDVPFTGSQGLWEYACGQIDIGALGGGTVAVSITPYNEGAVPVLVDDLAFASFDGQFVANVYDEPYYLLVAEVGPFKTVSRWLYDAQLRLIARTESEENVAVASTTYLSRQASDVFDAAVPNINVNVGPTGTTFYDRFSNGGDWSANWSSPQRGDWVSEGGWLRHTASAAGVITLTSPAVASDYFAALDLAPAGAVTGPIGLQLGGAATVLWDPAAQRWKLTDTSGPTTIDAQYTSSDPGRSWLLAVTDTAMLFFVDGRPTFSYLPPQVIQGSLSIVTSDPVGFTNVVVGQSPEIAATFVDGSGKVRQQHAVDGTAALVSATLYDELGRAAVTTKSASYDADPAHPLLAYRGSFAMLDWASGVMSGDVAASYPADAGFPYSRQRYEASPLGRVIEAGMPGKPFAIRGSGPHTLRHAYGTNVAGGFPQPLKLPAGQYFVTTTTDQDGTVSIAVSDSLGKPVAAGTQLSASAYVTSSSRVQYQPTGPVTTTFLPNYYNPPDAGRQSSWVVTQTYDMLGRLLSRREPDAGLTRYAYDLRGSRRFWQDAAALAAGVILFAKYDPLGRVLEQGRVPGTWDQDVLAGKAVAEPAWPGAGDGAVAQRRFSYDGDGSDPTLLGRLATASVASLADPATTAYRSAYTYDAIGRVLSETVQAPPYGDTSYVTGYAYDNLSRAVSVSYPSGLELVSTRNPLGFVEQIGEPGGLAYVAYTYLPTGQIATETLNPGQPAQISRTYGYNSPGWIASIDDDVLKATIEYTANGYQGAGYYSGKIAAASYALNVPKPGGFPTTVAYAYDYDRLGRLTNAECTADGSVASEWSVGVSRPVSYDDNGNFLLVPQGAAAATYTYPPGSNFTINTDGSADKAYVPGPGGSVVSAAPRSIDSIAYDVLLGRPASLQLPTGAVRLDYDIGSRRLLKRVLDEARLYLRARSGEPLEERVRTGSNGGTESIVDYLYGPSGLLVLRSDGEARTVVADHLGSTRALVDPAKNVLAAYQYLPFGGFIEPVFARVPHPVRYLFAGQELDPESGLYNMGARLYDPALARFYSIDPARQFASPYIYANNNPISFVDPTGEFSFEAFLVGALLAVVGLAAIIVSMGADAPLVGPAVAAGESAVAAWSGASVGAVEYGVMATGSIAGGTSFGAGVSGIQYAATHNRLDGSEFGEALAQGAISGAVSGAVNFGITAITSEFLNVAIANIASKFWRASINAIRSGAESAVAALPGQAVANVATKEKADAGLLDSFVIGFGAGAFTGFLTAPKPKAPAAAGDGQAAAGGGHADADVAGDANNAVRDAQSQPGVADQPGPRAANDVQPQAQPQGPVAQAAPQSTALVVYQPPTSFAQVPRFRINPAAMAFMRTLLADRPLWPRSPNVLNVPGGRFTFTDRSAFNLPPLTVFESTAPLALPWYGNT
jgi:RHS repeat-associated protein